MQDEVKLLSLLGICRKGGLAGFGHDAAKAAMREKSARLCIVFADASDRLRGEFRKRAEETQTPLLELPLTAAQVKQATRIPAAVVAINEKGLAQKIRACAESCEATQ
ncbi:MAG: hypothetical protein LBC83_04585 [Oscillospiraceae bacterium]|jgi:ribosomal protein L7Ae-like RNA K-turn-binding protein|nr:hypothetical protein [Oscillospiraceae bacterium]